MKLVAILARELKEWPLECEHFFADLDNEVRGSPVTTFDFYPANEVAIEDRRVQFCDEHHIVTRAQWEAERARILLESQRERDPLIQEITSSVSVGYQLEHDSEAEEVKQYEQELWDKVALDAQAMIFDAAGQEEPLVDIARRVGLWADAFMAERAKRIKEKK